FFFFQAEDGIRDRNVTGVQTCALPIYAIPASNDAFAMFSRASILLPFATAWRNFVEISLIACIGIESVTGLAPNDKYDSTACVNASKPVAAVRPAGFPVISSGSLIDTKGVFLQLTMTNFIFFSVFVITQCLVTSLPVPAVVLTDTIGGSGLLSFSIPA